MIFCARASMGNGCCANAAPATLTKMKTRALRAPTSIPVLFYATRGLVCESWRSAFIGVYRRLYGFWGLLPVTDNSLLRLSATLYWRAPCEREWHCCC